MSPTIFRGQPSTSGPGASTAAKRWSFRARCRRMLRVACWNALLLACGLGLVAVAAEAWLRLSLPFGHGTRSVVVVPEVGLHFAAGTEVRGTNLRDFWTVSHTNSLGFLDREPPSAVSAQAGCHVAVVGDSFVEAVEVEIAAKFHVLLEEMAARSLPGLDVSTAAYSYRSTGQLQQLPLWDKWIRHSRPKMVVLVFVDNDFGDNGAGGPGGPDGWFAWAERAEDGSIALRLPSRTRPPTEVGAAWLWHRIPRALRPYSASWFARGYRDWEHRVLAPPVREIDFDFTAFALDEWQKRTRGRQLVILSSHRMRMKKLFEPLTQMAEDRGIPVVDQFDYILRQGRRAKDAQWRGDYHWSHRGHRWAAEVLLEYLQANPDACDD